MTVHNALGCGYKEAVYDRALGVELHQCELNFQPQFPVQVLHEDVLVGLFYLDFLVEEIVVIETKALAHLMTGDEQAQVINYLKATGAPVGLLINFGRRRLEYHRIFPPRSNSGPVQRLGRDNVIKPPGFRE